MQGAPPSGTGARGRFGAGMGGPGGNSQELTQALAYVKAHGGGTLGVSSQQGAGSAVIAGKDVAGIGGFSGRESQVSVTWLARRDERRREVLHRGLVRQRPLRLPGPRSHARRAVLTIDASSQNGARPAPFPRGGRPSRPMWSYSE
jgi:hypothetical protein